MMIEKNGVLKERSVVSICELKSKIEDEKEREKMNIPNKYVDEEIKYMKEI